MKQLARIVALVNIFIFYALVAIAQPGGFDFLKNDDIHIKPNVDPMKVTELVLDNGLTVYLNEDPNISNVFGAVAVKGGSKRDPKDHTGIAHYFEHILFKGTQEIGTIDYVGEKVFLDSIKLMYDELGQANDEEQRKKIQSKINDLSLEASKFAIPNELDKVLKEMGGSGVNAYTSKDAIVYYNYFPGNQLAKWLETYSHRFEHPVYRLFQSELETVYEEKNMSMDDPFSGLLELFEAELFKGHPYSQTILGEIDHLKNPSLKHMDDYFNKYYVANNMALILVGNFKAEQAIPMIKEKFGAWRSGKIEPFAATLEPIKKRVEIKKRLTPIKVGLLGFHSVPAGHPDEMALKIANSVLSNYSSTGLFDKLANDNMLMMAEVMSMPYIDAGVSAMIVVPKLFGQTLGAAEKLVMKELDVLKAGDFDDQLVEAIKTELIVSHEKGLENGKSRGYYIIDAFMEGKTWTNVLNTRNEIEQITKEDIVKVANKYYGSNCIAIYSRTGFPKKHKLDKPAYEAVQPENIETTSEKAAAIAAMPVAEEPLKFIKKGRDVYYSELSPLMHYYYVPNPVNTLFDLTLSIGVGTSTNPHLSYTSELLALLGTNKHTAEEFNREMQQLGSQFYVYASRDYFTIRMTGLDENLERTLQLVKEKLYNAKPDYSKMKNLVQTAKSEIKMERKDPYSKSQALNQYVLHGNESYYLDRFTVKEIKALTADKLVQEMKMVWDYEVAIHYSGVLARNDVEQMVKGMFNTVPSIESKSPSYRAKKVYNEPYVFFINDKKAIQSRIKLLVAGEINSREQRVKATAFNKYFSSDMSSIVFQEIREFRSLAYSAYAYLGNPFHDGKPGYLSGTLSTQADKTTEAIEAMKELIVNMPQKPERIDQVKNSLIQDISSNKPTFRWISRSTEYWRMKGYTEDPAKYNLDIYKELSFDDILNVWEKNVAGKPVVLLVVGDENRIDMEKLKSYGTFVELDLDDVFTK